MRRVFYRAGRESFRPKRARMEKWKDLAETTPDPILFGTKFAPQLFLPNP